MKNLFIAKDVAYAARATVATINSMADGECHVFEKNGAGLSTAGIASSTEDALYIAMGVESGGNPYISRLIDRKTCKVEMLKYQAATAKKMALGAETTSSPVGAINLPSAIEEGMEMNVWYTNLDKTNTDPNAKILISQIATSTDTYATLFTKFIAKFNAEVNINVTVAQIGTQAGLMFTSGTAGENFAVKGGGILADADRVEYHRLNEEYNSTTTCTELKKGVGTPSKLLAMEYTYNANDGAFYTHRPVTGMWDVASRVASGGTYDLHVITWMDSRRNVTSMKTTYEVQLVIAMPTGTNSTALGTYLAAIPD